MKTTNKILLTAFILGLIVTSYYIIKISSYIQINDVELSGIIEKREYQIENFDNLTAEKGIIIHLIQSQEEKLFIEADTALFKLVEVVSNENKLEIRLSKSLPDSLRANVYLYTNNLTSIRVDKAAKLISTTPFTRDSLYLDAQRGANLNMQLNINYLNCQLASGAKAELSGKTKELNTRAQTRSRLYAKDLAIENAIVKSESGAQLYVFVSGTFDVKALSGGTIEYQGDPQITNIDISSGGKLSKGL